MMNQAMLLKLTEAATLLNTPKPSVDEGIKALSKWCATIARGSRLYREALELSRPRVKPLNLDRMSIPEIEALIEA